MLRIFIGYDPREAAAYHVCVNSIIRHSSVPVSVTPLHLGNLRGVYEEVKTDASNAFGYSRFLVPYLCEFQGQALFVDGDMVFRDDPAKLFEYLTIDCDVAVVKHDYKTKHPVKYFGASNRDYPRKNWSSVVLWNCAKISHRVLTPDYIASKTGEHLHRFAWLEDSRIGEIPLTWNWLCDEYEHNEDAKLYHWTLGVPGITQFEDADHCAAWHDEFDLTMQCEP